MGELVFATTMYNSRHAVNTEQTVTTFLSKEQLTRNVLAYFLVFCIGLRDIKLVFL